MTPRILRAMRLALTGLAATLVLVTGTFAEAPAAMAAAWTPISGTGSTWSQNALDQWRRNVASNYGMTVNYSGTGSSAGRRDYIAQTVDFAVSEIPFQSKPEDGSAPEKPTSKFAYMPIVAGGTAFMYNLKIGGKRVTNLRLSGDTITKIFTGVITNWKDPQIQKDNPGLAMPDKGIVPVTRSDGSGSTAQFTLWMSKQHPSLWNAFCGKVGRPNPCGLTSQYPSYAGFKAQSGSLGVAGYVSQSYGEGAITYVEYSYALKSGFPVAKVLNSAGYYIEPTAPSVAVALMKAAINNNAASPEYLTQILDGVYNNADARTYPLSSYSYMIVPTETSGIFTTDKGKTLGAFTNYMLCEGQQQAATLGYSPLPMNLVLAGFEQIKRIPGADVSGVKAENCRNPTFKAGDSPSNNQLAVSAPQPAACDKQGPNQCTTGTAGAKNTPTDTTGSGSGGSSAGAGGAGGSGTSGAGAGAGGTDGGAVDGSTGEGGVNVSVNVGLARATPYALADDGWGGQQTVMLIAGALVVLAIALPPLFVGRLRRSRGRSGD
ncbi:phosphate ABC transporter substrate-binding protein PstS [Leifsonia poae]|uniref:phosphate ABC transporter substrate-binding protein PstS n=1 Tax=Leifsonia poae TaxID=110933 RepID=UPI001CBB5529|nr:phosphate ABC transporter substrate-binding protein PstS [Leifsonia poae]